MTPVARVRAGDTSAKGDVLKLLTGDDTPYWKAVAANVIDPWLSDVDVQHALISALDNTNALLRAHAASALGAAAQGRVPAVQVALRKHLADASRNVRVNAAWGLRDEVPTDSQAGRELEHFLRINADQPTGQLQLGTWHLARGDAATALGHFEKAVAWDPNSAPLHHELAVLYGSSNRPQDALRELQAAVRLDPGEAEFQYKLGLAWNETGDLAQATQALTNAVELNPRHTRAWYNLGLARQQQGQTATALDALFRAESLDERDPQIPFARATIHAQAGQTADARQAAQHALSLRPNYLEARRLLDSLRTTQ